jgi:hypothetical protein
MSEYLKDGSNVTLSLLITMRCGFRCAHCCYDCGPEQPGDYMSDEVVGMIVEQADHLRSIGMYPEFNVIGGEPTLNMNRLIEILDRLMRQEIPVTMTTNGWWLRNKQTIRNFLNAVGPYTEWGFDAFSVRISDDGYHRSFRPTWMQDADLRRVVSNIWDDNVLEDVHSECQNCGEEFDRYVEPCPTCGGQMYHDYEYALDYDVPPGGDPGQWLYTEHWDGADHVLPQGRGASFGRKDPGSQGKCFPMYSLSYLPDGRLMDICCSGSWLEAGTVWDDPALLLLLAHKFIKDEPGSCAGCRERAVRWVDTQLPRRRRQAQRWLEKWYAAREYTPWPYERVVA